MSLLDRTREDLDNEIHLIRWRTPRVAVNRFCPRPCEQGECACGRLYWIYLDHPLSECAVCREVKR